jgi:hypothetical protein
MTAYHPHPFDDPGSPEAAAIRHRWREDFGWHLGDPQPENRDGSLTEAGHALLTARRKEATDGR